MPEDTIVLPLAETLARYNVYAGSSPRFTATTGVLECIRCGAFADEGDWNNLTDILRLVAEHEVDHHPDDPDLPQQGHPMVEAPPLVAKQHCGCLGHSTPGVRHFVACCDVSHVDQ